MLKNLLAILLMLTEISCTTPGIYPSSTSRPRRDYVAYGSQAAISTAHPLASQAGLAILKEGGNAADAAIAASFVISVVRPHSTGLGGGGFLLYHNPDSKALEAWDFRERAPSASQKDMFLTQEKKSKDYSYKGQSLKHASQNGPLSVGTPGLISGLLKFYHEHASMPLARLMSDAIAIAENGFPVYPSLEAALKKRQDAIFFFPASQKIFAPNRSLLTTGDLLIQKDLGKTLRAIQSQGADVFYRGWIAKKITQDIQKYGGILSPRDFITYTTRTSSPLIGTYKGYTIASMPLPSSGGIHLIQMLNMLEDDTFNTKEPMHYENLHIIAETMKRAYADRAHYLGDPLFVKVPTNSLISKAYAKKLRQSIQKDATPADQIHNGSFPIEPTTTTHISVVDAWGKGVSTTQTINGYFGSGMVAEGTGIVLNNEMDDFTVHPNIPNLFGLMGNEKNEIAPKKTMLSSMTPTMVFDQKGSLHLLAGSPGGSRIINATFWTIFNALSHKMTLADAVHKSRIHHQWKPDTIYHELDLLPKETIQKLQEKGHTLKSTRAIGDVQAIMKRPDGSWTAVSDTRSDGQPLAF
ncbi:MAG: gamma-glutamyltransferase [Oligoflexales bacterium]